MTAVHEALLAHYKFEERGQIGKDSSGRGNHAIPAGNTVPRASLIDGRHAVSLPGGPHGTSFLQLPEDVLEGVNDDTGISVAAWVRLSRGTSVWERIVDFGSGEGQPSLFLTRQFRGTLAAGGDLLADPGRGFANQEWLHVAISVIGTKGGQRSNAGPVVYVNGEAVADGTISQTSSGQYAKLRHWFSTLSSPSNYRRNYLGHSQFAADDDFAGDISEVRIYKAGLSGDQVIEVMCSSLSDEEIVKLACAKYLKLPTTIVAQDLLLPAELLGGAVKVKWQSDRPEALSDQGKLQEITEAHKVSLTATVSRGLSSVQKVFTISAIPHSIPPYTLDVHGNQELAEVSDVMYGLFYEDINNAADGGIYAELVQNRSFEAFAFDTYSHTSGACGCSTGRNRDPLFAWSGDTDKMHPLSSGGLRDHFAVQDEDVNAYYVKVENGATIRNKGFSDSNQHCAMSITKGAGYGFTVWAKAEAGGSLELELQDPDGAPISDKIIVEIEHGGEWKQYGLDKPLVLTGSRTSMGQLALTFHGEICMDMVSLIPQDVWGAGEEADSPTARANYLGNPNYRLRKDLVQALLRMHPKFLRFPGGCISEGSFIWDNVYDWKDSVGPVELRKENYNVWGYMMTMGLGYMEYFQLAEDLNAAPLPVMACGVLCQARSDYAHPAGGRLREYYIKNFTDLIDFAINTDDEGNEWAALRKAMGHPAPFDLHYLGVGNENWGTEFFANFEVFKAAIDRHMEQHYPGYELHIISTVGAQADDDAYQQGWKFLSGNLEGSAQVAFTDGQEVIEETVVWYARQQDYMVTIADEHYYRSNEYLLQNVDRYNYYYRAYQADGSLDWKATSKVFVGEYASTDKNTLAGAVAEAAMMTGFENNADVVRLAAYAPLFNKVLTDGTYRWTPDCIWFDDESVWFTPNYYVQQLYAKYLGSKVLKTSFSTYRDGKPFKLSPYGGIEIATAQAELLVQKVTVTSNRDGRVLLFQDFTQPLHSAWRTIPGSAGYELRNGAGLVLKAQHDGGRNGIYLLNEDWSDYKVEVVAMRLSGEDGFYIGAGLTNMDPEAKDVIEYAIGYEGRATGVKVYKQGVEAYTLGDYSSSTAAGNLRAACYEPVATNVPYTITLNYGGGTGERIICSYTDGRTQSRVLDYKLEAYNREIHHSVTRDAEQVYIKLVNADPLAKTLRLNVHELAVEQEARWIVLGGDSSLVQVPNVNQKDKELITPQERKLRTENASVMLELPASSVHVLVLKLKA